ncbi:MAG: deoxynucleoside kinase [Myxococcales bacterium]|nr:deoxynucleoside kinase [Myxococcales bacterium]
MSRFPRYIVVEGPIGVGKTTLVEQLTSHLNARVILEQFEENPFLADFYKDRSRYAFQTELYFLLSRFRQQEAFQQEDLFHQHTVSDYFFHKCRLFASLNLGDHELALFDHIYQILRRSIPQPDLVIHLHAPVDVLSQRILQRNRSYEREMDLAYLEQLSQLYAQELAPLRDDVPVLSLDTSFVDFRLPENVQILIEEIQAGKRGRLDTACFLRAESHTKEDVIRS